MNWIKIGTPELWNALLVISVIFAAFMVTEASGTLHRLMIRTAYSVIFIVVLLAIEKLSNYFIVLIFVTLFLEWVSGLFDLQIVFVLSRGVNVIFSTVIVGSLIKQIATAGKVTAGVVSGSISGFLLPGIICSIFVTLIIVNGPSAFSSQPAAVVPVENVILSIPMYFSYVMLASLGYGHIVPLKLFTCSLATLISCFGAILFSCTNWIAGWEVPGSA